ncbi:MAG: T9SS type A sorting domain-containing protein, partial [Eudoraea sp.]|nr:T9SS type A sorting domain-containing protein [Eudoraea sp.]NNJ40872.1 T9SS type A sorting domain-containing protein [Eudoraea sp.]
LYTLEKGTNHLYRITADTGDVEDLGEVPILSGFNYTYGAVYFDVDGNFYVSANQTGSVYKISRVQEVQSGIMTSNIFAFGPSSSSNDGARCPTAPVLQEDCSNGIDDDGDGLIDCDDPACSGISSCPTITTTSGANKGGLESNDRLAQLISNRNYKRVKDNYIFDKAQAKKVTKDNNYKKRAIFSKTQLPLSSFVPLGVIGETTTIESSPKDLLDLTNASDIFSVDYLKDMETVSALMVIKTEEQVYEHSKFICDRFLGASLLSVSTIEIRGQKFIKSIIKQPDGSIEFALSFSARLNKENQFIIESHWNMDAFTANSMYYNFQIWSNTIDDLFVLGEEILSLLEVQGPIAGFRNSDPPPVFVKTARYHRGAVQLEIVNTNESNNISLAGGLKKTETAITESLGVELALSGYTDYVTIETGALFDLGFRINPDNAGTPDDLFVADAPWGLDASSASTSITRFSVTQNDSSFDEEVHAVERNIVLEGTTREYLGVYRAFNPRFLAVDLSAFNSLSFDASGTGTLEVVLLKSGGSKFYTEVVLVNDQKTFSIKDSDFRGVDGQSTDFSDLKVVLFNMKSENGTTQYKRLLLSKVFFEDAIIQESEVFVTNRESIIAPNPVRSETTLYVNSQTGGSYVFSLYNLTGKRIDSHILTGTLLPGQNEIKIQRKTLEAGIYMYKLQDSNKQIWSGKLIVR